MDNWIVSLSNSILLASDSPKQENELKNQMRSVSILL